MKPVPVEGGSMKAIVMHSFGGREQLKCEEMPIPQPGDGEVLLRVKAAGVNPVDWKIREGKLSERLQHRFPLIPGWDAAAGIIYRYVFVRPEAEHLDRLAALIDAGKLRVHLAATLPLEAAAKAHEMVETGHTRGKIVLTME